MVMISDLKNTVSENKGFSLIELLVSILLLSIVLLGGMGFYFYSNENQVIANHRRAATELANARLEQIRHYEPPGGGYSGYLPNSAPPPDPSNPDPTYGLWQGPDDVDVEGLPGQQRVYVFDVDDDADSITDFKEVQVKITWNEPNKTGLQEVLVDTYFAP